MKIEVHVASVDDIAAARADAEAQAQEGDEIVVVVDNPLPPTERQEMVQVKAPGR